VSEATAGRRQAGSAARNPTGRRETGPVLDRRRVLRLALAVPAAAAVATGCTGTTRRKEPDPLVALADAARADAALAVAAVAADPALAARVEPLRAARTEHAAALDAEVVRVGGVPGTATPMATPTAAPAAPPSGAAGAPATAGSTAPGTATPRVVTLAQVREAVAASQQGAADLVPDLPAERVGLVASVAACCATYAAVLT
jgi:hypothetical protein